MYKVAGFSDKERSELFRETASRMHTTKAIVEKDFWVVFILDKLFSHKKLSKILMFKGGTSLSKIYGLIERFSEDIDLILNWDLLTDEDPYKERTKTQQGKFNTLIKEKAKEFIRTNILPMISKILSPLCKCKIKKDDEFSIEIQYPAIFSDSAILPHILLEIGPLASWLPSGEFDITSFAAKEFPQVFEKKSCKVKAVLAERTFWEKATILHQQANRSEQTIIPLRYSRHYYDLAMMAKSGVKEKALADLKLLKSVVEFKQKFYACNWAKYEKAKPGMLKLIPPEYRYKELREDYKAMKNMIFGKTINFDKILVILSELETEINALSME